MTALNILSGLILATQPAPPSAVPAADVQVRDVAYEDMSAGRSEQAIAALEAQLESNPDDPATLINLGTAYFRANRLEDAREAFREAAASEERYRVELADGSWEDSRKIARMALDSLDRTALAAN